jgi:hypothetical protein
MSTFFTFIGLASSIIFLVTRVLVVGHRPESAGTLIEGMGYIVLL